MSESWQPTELIKEFVEFSNIHFIQLLKIDLLMVSNINEYHTKIKF